MTKARASSLMRTVLTAGCFLTNCLLFSIVAYPQPEGVRPVAFETASIRPTTAQQAGGEGSSRSQIQYTPDSLTMQNIDLGEMIQWAYSLQQYQATWSNLLNGTRYDIRAKTAASVSLNTLRLLLQDLLATRFKLQLHREQTRTSVYELVVAKGGPHLSKDKTGALPPGYPKQNLPHVVDGGFVFTNVTLDDFAKQLTELRGIDLPVVDRTGIPGIYDITLKSSAAAILDPNGPSLLTLIHEQLGLKLISAKDPVELIVIDHIAQPSAN
ncbi:MAG TPA: TIGR03435 family protein [Terracidiphilus sp.]|jgi:uncharacterized protein (TIGR03435 family)